jgi:hypothetical protein
MRRGSPRKENSFQRATMRRARPLDSPSRAAIAHFVRVLSRCGYSPGDIALEALKSSQRIPKVWLHSAEPGESDTWSFGQVLTLWFSDPAYLDERGSPRALPLHGALSLDALLKRTAPDADLQRLLRYPLRSGALRRVGKRYVPTDRIFLHRGSEGLSHPLGLRGLFGLLKTLDYNRGRPPDAPVRLQLFAYNSDFPVRARGDFERRASETGSRLLSRFDGDMHHHARLRKRREPKVLMGVGIYLFEERASGKAPSGPRRTVKKRSR